MKRKIIIITALSFVLFLGICLLFSFKMHEARVEKDCKEFNSLIKEFF